MISLEMLENQHMNIIQKEKQMPAYAAVATENGDYIFCGGQPVFEDDTKIVKPAKAQTTRTAPQKSNLSTVGAFASLSRERSARLFGEKDYRPCRSYESHGRHGRKRIKARHLPD